MRNLKFEGFRSFLLATGASLVPLCAMSTAAMAQSAAEAENGAAQADDETQIIVTGSSIRGVPPVGSNLIEVGRSEIEATGAYTIQDVLASVPQLQTFNTAPRPEPRPGQGAQSTAPSLRGLGAQQTLTLINGHRIVGIGTLQTLADPAVVAPAALSRIEVIADGASAIYGSDAIAGVVNVITRSDVDGVEASASYGFGERFSTYNADIVAGKKWSDGYILSSATYARSSAVNGQDVDFFDSDRRSVGGVDNRSRNCANPTVRANGVDYAFPLLAPNTFNICDNAKFGDIFPEQTRVNLFLAGRQSLSDKIEFFGDANYSRSTSDWLFPPATPGAFTINNTNPFFRPIPGAPTITSYSVTANLQNITGRLTLPQEQKAWAFNAFAGLDIDLPSDFKMTITAGGGESSLRFVGDLADNAAITAAAAGTTRETALDPFGGMTSQAVLNAINNLELIQSGNQTLLEGQIKIDGPLASLPGGDLKVAVGGGIRKEKFDGTNSTGTIGAAVPASNGIAGGDREVLSAFAELFVPIFGDDNGFTGLRKLDLSLSGRFDKYDDFGSTFNPKIGVNWNPIDDLTLRGSYGTSFHAPQLSDLFGPDSRAEFTPNQTGALIPAGSPPLRSILIAGGNLNLEPETADTLSFGFDLKPSGLDGFSLSATYYEIDFKNQVGFPVFALLFTDPGFAPFIFNNPTTATVTQLIGDFRTVNFTRDAIPVVDQVLDLRRGNFGQILTTGVDFNAAYRFDSKIGTVGLSLAGNYTIDYKTRTTPTSVQVEQIDAGGITTIPFSARAAADVLTDRGDRFTIAANFSSEYEAAFRPTAGGNAIETVDSFLTVDARASVKLGTSGYQDSINVILGVDNLFDQDPPEVRSGNGIGRGNLLGRVVTIGIRKVF